MMSAYYIIMSKCVSMSGYGIMITRFDITMSGNTVFRTLHFNVRMRHNIVINAIKLIGQDMAFLYEDMTVYFTRELAIKFRRMASICWNSMSIYCVVHVFLKYDNDNFMIVNYIYLEIFNCNFVIVYTV